MSECRSTVDSDHACEHLEKAILTKWDVCVEAAGTLLSILIDGRLALVREREAGGLLCSGQQVVRQAVRQPALARVYPLAVSINLAAALACIATHLLLK